MAKPLKSRATHKGRGTNRSLSDQAYEGLEEMIVTLRLEAGAVLSEAELSEKLGIGRTPIREALQRLAREGLVLILPRKGILVSEINPGKQLLLLEVRRELEAHRELTGREDGERAVGHVAGRLARARVDVVDCLSARIFLVRASVSVRQGCDTRYCDTTTTGEEATHDTHVQCTAGWRGRRGGGTRRRRPSTRRASSSCP